MTKKPVDMVWWLNVTASDFYYVEKAPQPGQGGGEQTYFIIGKDAVQLTFDFLDYSGDYASFAARTIHAAVVGEPGVGGPLQFQKKSGDRLRISNQNRQRDPNPRHPAWRAERGFPAAPNSVANTDDARNYLPRGGLRLYIVKTADAEYAAGFTQGIAPTDLADHDPMRSLYGGSGAGLIRSRGARR